MKYMLTITEIKHILETKSPFAKIQKPVEFIPNKRFYIDRIITVLEIDNNVIQIGLMGKSKIKRFIQIWNRNSDTLTYFNF